jgi:hypothetical protein
MSPPQEAPLRDLAAAEPPAVRRYHPPAALESATSPPWRRCRCGTGCQSRPQPPLSLPAALETAMSLPWRRCRWDVAAAEPAPQSAASSTCRAGKRYRRRGGAAAAGWPPQSRPRSPPITPCRAGKRHVAAVEAPLLRDLVAEPPRSPPLSLPGHAGKRHVAARCRLPLQSRPRSPPRSLHLRAESAMSPHDAVCRCRAGFAVRRGHSTCRAGKHHVAAAGGAPAAPSDPCRAGPALRRHSACRAGKRHVSARAAVRRCRAGPQSAAVTPSATPNQPPTALSQEPPPGSVTPLPKRRPLQIRIAMPPRAVPPPALLRRRTAP